MARVCRGHLLHSRGEMRAELILEMLLLGRRVPTQSLIRVCCSIEGAYASDYLDNSSVMKTHSPSNGPVEDATNQDDTDAAVSHIGSRCDDELCHEGVLFLLRCCRRVQRRLRERLLLQAILPSIPSSNHGSLEEVSLYGRHGLSAAIGHNTTNDCRETEGESANEPTLYRD